jgi:phytoene desaturase
VTSIVVSNGQATSITLADGTEVSGDAVISNADLHFTETVLLASEHQTYPESYWKKRQNGPSALLMYLGVKGKLPQLEHHNLYFTDDWRGNFNAIFKDKSWPDPASMYICKPSATDASVAPKGHENIFVLVPLPARDMTAGETEELTARYFDQLKHITGIPDLEQRIVYKHVYTPADFAADYNSWQGSALGLSHTLRQSALLRPRNRSRKVKNLYYVGGNTIPGIGLPMCLIGAELVYKHLTHNTGSKPLEQL